ncbi:hypothetical protein SAMN05216302_101163 [Nitrosomonas aestuarii]|uniref:Uncharacterized protein n=1 Tax=Nitrosomonas aestuarii TaxID=52441 RepID=A0A1I4B6B5_9PROT|nr:hypothetical protein [Nitrosomonas aestuarii]SFK64462.1 hypothetical protein SAMN05216302_101163 [Nitrosomonas aestuarii]
MKYTKQDEIELFQKFSENHKKRLEAERAIQARKRRVLMFALSVSMLVNAALINYIFW